MREGGPGTQQNYLKAGTAETWKIEPGDIPNGGPWTITVPGDILLNPHFYFN